MSADPTASLTLYDGHSFEYTFSAVTAGGSVPEYIAEISYSDSVESWLTNTLPFTTLGAYDLTNEAYITWSTTSNNLIKISYDGTGDVSSFVGGSAIVVTLKIADKLQHEMSTYTTSITVETATPPTFATNLPDSFTVYTTEAKTFNLPVVNSGTHGHDQPITVTSTGTADFTATWSVNAAAPFVLSYDGTHGAATTGSLTITLTNTDSISKTYTVPYTALEPIAPEFVTDPTDFRVVIGYDETYTFPTITDGSHSPTVLSVSIDTISASEYTFDAAAKNIKIHGTDTAVFDSLAGTTLTLTSTLSHSYATKTYT